MPLLRRLVFVKQKPPSDLKPDEELFFCKFTNEIFRDYEAFFERTILCNSLVWTCKYTGRPGLTYQEALDSEARARKNLRTFPEALKRPVLFLATLTRRGRLADMCDDVFVYTKDRFFVGETVEVLFEDSRLQCTILKVIPPGSENAGATHSDSENDLNTSNEENEKSKRFGPDPLLYQYEVQEDNEDVTYVASGADITRKKGLYTREKSKLFLKQHCDPHLGIWKVKDSILKKLNVSNDTFHELFAGPLPCFTNSPAKKRLPNDKETLELKKSKKKTVDESPPELDKKKIIKEKLKEDDPRLSAEEKAIIKEKIKQEIEEARMKKKIEKEKEREKLREERRLKAEYLKEWSKPRDDLECDDLKELPQPKCIETIIKPEQFGEMIALLEFLHVFGDYLEIEDEFPNGVSFESLEQALSEPDIQGPMCDLLHLFLGVMFRLQEEEDEIEEDCDIDNEASAIIDSGELGDEDLDRNRSLNFSQNSSTLIRPQLYLGTPIRNLPLDNCTVTEVLRLHLLCSGSKTTPGNAKFRYQQRGGFAPSDDPGMDFKLKETAIIQILSTGNVYDLLPADKLKILTCLYQQLLTYVSARDIIEDSCEKLRLLRNELKQLQWAEQRREREEAHARYMQRLQERNRERDTDQKIIKKSDEIAEVQDNVHDSLKENGSETGISKTENDDDSAIESAAEDENNIIDEELTSEEAERRRQERAKESAKKKEQYKIKEKELIENICYAQSISNIMPIGRDRFYRRFWQFNSLSGLFIEDDDSFKGPCPTNVNCSCNIPVKIEDDKSTNSDKENESFNGTIDKSIHPSPVIINGTAHLPHNTLASIDKPIVNYQTWPKLESKVFGCASTHKNCLSHNNHERTVWAYYSLPEEFDALINTLNPRGFREGPLRDLLISEKKQIVEAAISCPLDNENRLFLKKMKNKSNGSKLSGESALEYMLREMLLDIEERLYSGSLGTLKVKDRLSWKTALESKLQWREGTNNDLNEINEVNPAIKQLAQCLLDIVEGIDPKYLKPPLGEAEEKKPRKSDLSQTDQKKKRKVKEENTEDKEEDEGVVDPTLRQSKTMLDKWQESLKSTSSLSQIFLHLSTVERAVTWSRSSLNARCRICRRKGDAEHMLLCDGCNQGHHIYCLKPQMKEIPADDWFCTDCRPKTVRKKSRKRRRRRYSEDIDEDDDLDDSINYCLDEGLNESFSTEENYLNDSSQSYEDGGGDVCAVCSIGGTLILCDSCPLAFHLKCADPPLKKVPRGKWECHMCTGIADKRSSRDRSRSDRIAMKALKLQKLEKQERLEKSKVRRRIRRNKLNSELESGHKKKRGRKKKIRDDSTYFPENECVRKNIFQNSGEEIRPKKRGRKPKNRNCSLLPENEFSNKNLTDSNGEVIQKRKRGRKKKNPDLLLFSDNELSMKTNLSNSNEEVKPKKRGRKKKIVVENPFLLEKQLLTEPHSFNSDEESNKSSGSSRLAFNSSRRSSKGLRGSYERRDLKLCEELLAELCKQPEAWPFLLPVNKKTVPDYYMVINHPMDFSTMRNKMNNLHYLSAADFLADARLIFSNCEFYNMPLAPEAKAGVNLSKYLERRVEELNLENSSPTSPPSNDELNNELLAKKPRI